jgi:hypothetical protein
MSTMRGLTTFISDLRNARARELEEKRINKELVNIRGKFKGIPPSTSPYILLGLICGRRKVEWLSEEEVCVQIVVYLYSGVSFDVWPFGVVVALDFSAVQREADWISCCDVVVE